MTLEAALVMPVFLLFFFFLLFLIKISMISMAMHGALTQTARIAAASWYPISLVQQQQEAAKQDPATWQGKLESVRSTLGEYAEWLPPPLQDWAEMISEGTFTLEQQAAKASFRQIALQLADTRVLEADRFTILAVGIPKAGNAEEAYLTLQAEYRLPLQVPFAGRPLVLRSTARERAWVGGSPSRARSGEGPESGAGLSFVSLEPNPVRPGRKATLVLRTEPGAAVDLSVVYKSGISQARHLGQSVADDTGLVSWTWHVSGNTASGQWRWEAGGSGGVGLSQPFEVKRKHE